MIVNSRNWFRSYQASFRWEVFPFLVGCTLGATLLGAPMAYSGGDLGHVGTFNKWTKVEVVLQGPSSVGLSTSNNPFQIDVDVNFVGPSGQPHQVPAFYDGNGSVGMDGTVWKVRFSPDEVGTWSFNSTSPDSLLNGYQGTFTVDPVPGNAQFFAKWGRLEYVDGHYLKFRDGTYWVKGGADEPESFLGPGVMGDWNGKKSAVDYLASKNVNSMYIMLQNVDGDGRNVWPWASKYDSEHFDVAKLADWEDLFDHIQSKGIVLHLVFEDDSGWTGFNRSMYYREMIARFGHFNGLYWNISEEYNENYSSGSIKSFAQQIRDFDPYDHPITVHNAGSLSNWNPFLGDNRFDLTSFQTNTNPQNSSTITWRDLTAATGRSLPIVHDETGQFSTGDRDKSRKVVWSVYLGGGMIELFTKNVTSLGFRAFEDFWNDMRHSRKFLEALPFWEMTPNNGLIIGGSGNRYCFSKSGEVYAIYLENGGTVSLDLTGQTGTYEVKWYETKTGNFSTGTNIVGGGVVSLSSPVFSGDVAALVELVTGSPDTTSPNTPTGLTFQP